MRVPSRLREGLVQDEHRPSTWHTRGTELCCQRAGARGAQIESAVTIQLDHDAPGAGLTTIDSCSSSAGLSIPASTCTVNFCGSSVALAGTPLITPESASRLSPEGRSGEIRKPLSVRWSILRQSAKRVVRTKRITPPTESPGHPAAAAGLAQSQHRQSLHQQGARTTPARNVPADEQQINQRSPKKKKVGVEL